MAVTLALAFALMGGTASAQTFTNSSATAIPTYGPASPYPSALSVSGTRGTITHVRVTLHMTNYAGNGLDVVLQSPHGESVMVTSDVAQEIASATFPFDDAGVVQPNYSDTTGQTLYKPTDNDDIDSIDDNLDSPAPASPSATLSALNGQDANGTWKLFVQNGPAADSVTPDGSIDSWSLDVTTSGAPTAIVAPASLDFGSVVPPASSAPQTVTVTNTGDAPLNFSQAPALAGADATQFAVTNNGCPGQLAAGAACSVSVVFAPNSAGAKSASLSFADDASGSPQTVPLTGFAAVGSPAPPVLPAPQESGSPQIKVKQASFQSAVVGQPTYLDVTASDPKQQVTGLLVDFGESLGAYGESACVRGRNKPGSTTFHVPYEFLTPGDHVVKLTIFAGGCGSATAHTYVFTVHVAPAGAAARRVASGAAVEVTLTGPPITSKCKNSSLAPTRSKTKLVIKALLCVMNEQRKLNKLKPLKISKRLTKAALAHTRAMIVGKFFAHQGPREAALVSRLKKVKYRGAAGENLAAGAGTLGTPLAIVNGWMHSSLHRANLLSRKWKTVGVGFMPKFPVQTLGAPLATFTTDFGTKR